MADVGALKKVNLGNIGAVNKVNAGNIAAINRVPFIATGAVVRTLTVAPGTSSWDYNTGYECITMTNDWLDITVTATAGESWTCYWDSGSIWGFSGSQSGSGNGTVTIIMQSFSAGNDTLNWRWQDTPGVLDSHSAASGNGCM